MSDEERDIGADDDFAGGADPALASRLDAIHGSMSTLGTRIDALVTSTTTYRSALTDRLNEYADLVTKLTRAQASDLEEYRRTNERTLDTLHAALEELGRGLRPDLDGVVDTPAIANRIERMENELAGAGKVATESFGEIAGLRAKVDALLESTVSESDSVTGVLEQLKETLQDLASGEVVGALWDEVRQVRATVEVLVDRDAAGPASGDVDALHRDVTALMASLRELLEQAEVVDEQGIGESDASHLVALAADVAALRDELSQGLVVDPSDSFGSSVESLRTDLMGIGERLTVVADLRESVAELRAATEAADDVAPPAESTPELADQVATLRDQVTAEFERVRQLVEGGAEAVDLTPLTARLDRLHDDLSEAEPAEAGPAAADLAPMLDALHDVQAGIAALLERPVTAPAPEPARVESDYVTVDPDVIDLLREEIRGAGTASDELVETLSTELKALRRRIRLRAEGELFSDEQLEHIADAVARKLGE